MGRTEKRGGIEIGHSLEFDFYPTSAQLSRAVKADEIRFHSPPNHCVLLDNPKTIERLGLLSQPLFLCKVLFHKLILDGFSINVI